VARYYNSWIENTDQEAEEDTPSVMSAEASSHPEPQSSAAGDHEASRQSRPSVDKELSEWNVSTTDSVDEVDDDDDDIDVFCSFM